MDWMFEVGPAPTDPMSDGFEGTSTNGSWGSGSTLDDLLMDHDLGARRDEQARLDEMATPVAARDADLAGDSSLSTGPVASDYGGDDFYLPSATNQSASEAPTTPPPLGVASVTPGDPFTGGGGPQHIFWNGGGDGGGATTLDDIIVRSTWEQRMEAQRRLDEWMSFISATNPQLADNLGFGGYILDPALPVNDYLERWWQEVPPVMSDGDPKSEEAAALIRPHIATIDAKIDGLPDSAQVKLPDGTYISGADLKVAWHSMSFRITTGEQYGTDRSGENVNGIVEMDAVATKNYVGWGSDGAYLLILHELAHNTVPGQRINTQQWQDHIATPGNGLHNYDGSSSEFVYNEAWSNTLAREIGNKIGAPVETDPRLLSVVFGFLP